MLHKYCVAHSSDSTSLRDSLARQFGSLVIQPKETFHYMEDDMDVIIGVTRLLIEKPSDLFKEE